MMNNYVLPKELVVLFYFIIILLLEAFRDALVFTKRKDFAEIIDHLRLAAVVLLGIKILYIYPIDAWYIALILSYICLRFSLFNIFVNRIWLMLEDDLYVRDRISYYGTSKLTDRVRFKIYNYLSRLPIIGFLYQSLEVGVGLMMSVWLLDIFIV